MAVNPDFGIINNVPNAGQAFGSGFQGGMGMAQQQRRDQMMQNALAQFAQDPTSQQGVNALLQADPRLGIQAMGQQRQAADAQRQREEAATKEQREFFGRLAQAADTPEAWDAITQRFADQYPELAQYTGKFDPSLRAGLMAQAGLDPNQDKKTALQQNYEFLGTIDPEFAQQYIQRQIAEPPMIASNGDGTFTIIPRSQMTPTAPAPQAPQGEMPTISDPAQARNLPPGTQFRTPDGRVLRVPGGATGQSPSPTFPQP